MDKLCEMIRTLEDKVINGPGESAPTMWLQNPMPSLIRRRADDITALHDKLCEMFVVDGKVDQSRFPKRRTHGFWTGWRSLSVCEDNGVGALFTKVGYIVFPTDNLFGKRCKCPTGHEFTNSAGDKGVVAEICNSVTRTGIIINGIGKMVRDGDMEARLDLIEALVKADHASSHDVVKKYGAAVLEDDFRGDTFNNVDPELVEPARNPSLTRAFEISQIAGRFLDYAEALVDRGVSNEELGEAIKKRIGELQKAVRGKSEDEPKAKTFDAANFKGARPLIHPSVFGPVGDGRSNMNKTWFSKLVKIGKREPFLFIYRKDRRPGCFTVRRIDHGTSDGDGWKPKWDVAFYAVPPIAVEEHIKMMEEDSKEANLSVLDPEYFEVDHKFKHLENGLVYAIENRGMYMLNDMTDTLYT